MRLTRVLEDRHLVRASDVCERTHVGHLTVEMDGDEMRRACCRILRLPCVQGVVVVIDIDDDRYALGLQNSLECRRERRGGHDDAVTALEARRLEGEPQGVEATRDADAVTTTGSVGERELELADGSAVHKIAGVDSLRNPVENARLDRGVRGREVDEGD